MAYYAQPGTPVMTVAKDDGRVLVGHSDVLTYTVNFANTSNTTATPGAATNVVLSDTLPPNTTFVSCAIAAPYTGTCSQLAGVVTFTLNQTVNAGASGSVQVVVRVDANASGNVVNTVSLGYRDSLGNNFPPVTATDIDNVPPVGLRLTKSDDGITTAPAAVIPYALSYSNVGTATATGVVLSETVPANTRFNAGASSAGWSCADGSPAGTICNLTIGSLPTNASGSATFAVTVATPLPAGVTQIVNSATLRDGSGNSTFANDNTPLKTTAIALVSFTASDTRDGIVVRWVTSAEVDTWGYQLYRSSDATRANAIRVTPGSIPGQGRGTGASYSWTDTTAAAGVRYTYWLQETEINGTANWYGPASAIHGAPAAGNLIFIPLVER